MHDMLLRLFLVTRTAATSTPQWPGRGAAPAALLHVPPLYHAACFASAGSQDGILANHLASNPSMPVPACYPACLSQERLARARRREVQAVYSRRKQAAPWLSLPELQHMASLVRALSSMGCMPLPCPARQHVLWWSTILQMTAYSSTFSFTPSFPPSTCLPSRKRAPHLPAARPACPAGPHPQLWQAAGQETPGARAGHAKPCRTGQCPGGRRAARGATQGLLSC